MKKQVDVIVDAVKSILGDRYDANVKSATLLSSAELAEIQQIVYEGISNGTIGYSKDIHDEKAVRKYSISVVANHLSKNKKLNGNVTKEPEEVEMPIIVIEKAEQVDVNVLPPELR